MTARERDWELYKARNLIMRLGWKNWEFFQNDQQASLIELYDDFTLHLENNGASQVELKARRLLLVELRIQHLDLMASVFQMHHNDLNN